MAFPTSIEASTYFGEAYNNLSTTLSQIAGISDTTVYVASTTNWPSIGWFTIEDEIRSYTGKTTGSFTGCTPGSDNTTAAEHAAGKAVSLTFPAIMWTRAVAELRATQTKLGIGSGLITDTIAEKTTDAGVTVDGILIKDSLSVSGITPLSGWVETGTFAYLSATTITVAAGAASKYQKGDKLRFKQTAGTYKYYYVIGVADTVLTVTGGSDYTVLNEAITVPAYSHIENPLGFPHWFTVTAPTFDVAKYDNGAGGQPATTISRMKISGNMCFVKYNGSGTKASTDVYIIFNPSVYPAFSTPLSSSGYTYVGTVAINVSGIMIYGDSTTITSMVVASITGNTVITNFSFTLAYEI